MERTIAAVSTGLTPAGICIVRMSGPEALRIADRIFHKKSVRPENTGMKPAVSKMKSHTIHYGFISDGKEDLDEVLLSVMRAPHTFTGEDTVEINCHGGIRVAKKVLELLLERGAFSAEPGEFTKRAFLNGKMDLTKAEAVIDVIEAKNDFALRSSVSQLKGAVSEKIRALREILLDEISFIEAAIDDPEHYELEGYGEELLRKLLPVREETEKLLQNADKGSVLSEGVRTVIAGRPNAGKSSLLNILSGYEKAIVTEVAGTTRDVLEVPVLLSGISLLLMDTAGIRDTDDKVEKIGVDRAKNALNDADLILYVADSTEGLLNEDFEILGEYREKNIILIWNKEDLSGASEKLPEVKKEDGSFIPVIRFSMKTGEGLSALEEKITYLYNAEELTYNDQVIITNARQKEALREAKASIELVLQGIKDSASEEFLAIDLTNAYASFGKIIGEEVGDDVINRIFEKFCMGK